MNRIILFLICCGLTAGGLMAQQEAPLKPQITKSCYFDVSPPLRDLAKMANPPSDNTWKEGVIKNNFFPPEPQEKTGMQADHTIQNSIGPRMPDSVTLSFDGTNNVCSCFPPDTDGDVGPNHYFQVVNLHFAIYDKSGNKLMGPLTNSTIFNGMPNNSNDGDGIVLYDEVADRWIFSQFSLPNYPSGPFYENVAVSQTNDPTGAWYRYQFSYTDMPDYPKLAVWPDGIYMSSNRFSAGSISYIGIGASVFDKSAMYSGASSATKVSFTLPASSGRYMLPADNDGSHPVSGTPEFFLYISGQNIKFYKFVVDWATTSNSQFTLIQTIPVTSFNGNVPNVPQPGTSIKLESMGGFLMHRAPFRVFTDHWAISACMTVYTGGHAAIRWWELRNDMSNPGGWTIYQESTYAPDNEWRWMGSISMDSLSNMALGYSISSSATYPSVRYTGRLATDPLNEMTVTEGVIKAGNGSQTYTYGGRSRWGDYSAMNADPSDVATFWYTQEYYASTSPMAWRTRIGRINFGNILMAFTSATPSLICKGQTTQLGVTASGGSGSYTYSWTSNPGGFTSSQQNPTATPSVSTYFICTVNDGTASVMDSVLVTVQQPAAPYAGPDTVVCLWQSQFNVHGQGTGYDQLLWSTTGDGHFVDPTVLSTTYIPWTNDKLHGVNLILTFHSAAPCTGNVSDTMRVTFDECTGIGNISAKDLVVKVQPNPSNGIFDLTVENLDQTARVNISDLNGHSVYQQSYLNQGTVLRDHLNLTNLAKGTYFLKVTTDTRNRIEKLIIQ